MLGAAVVLAVAVRVAGLFLLPNIDGDAYCYLDKAAQLRAAVLAGTLRPADLFYFWLPLYPMTVALGSLALPGGHLMLVGKLISALSGVAACWLVYRLLAMMTRRPAWAAAGALLVALDPWQVLYSSNTMTELPFEAVVLGALDRTIARRWTAASLLLVAAGFVRIEAWGLAALMPVAAFVVERRLRLAPVLLTGIAPAAWLAISHAATGDALAYFHARNVYVAEYLAYRPEQLHLTAHWAAVDLSNLSEAMCGPSVVGAALAVGFLAWNLLRRHKLPAGAFAAGAVAAVYGFLLVFLLAAYATRSQPVLWVRYGLIYQPLGVCLTLWWLAEAVRGNARRFAVGLLAVWLAGHAATEAWIVRDTGKNLLFQRQAGAILVAAKPHRVYCDSAVVCVEAGLGRDRVRDSFDVRHDPAGFLEDLRRQQVDYLVFIVYEVSVPVKLFPELADFRPAHGLEPFQKITSPDWRPSVLIYRVQSAPNPVDSH